jgi:hypothetical protein
VFAGVSDIVLLPCGLGNVVIILLVKNPKVIQETH